jgi:DNA transposition AAA+ family ATPase
MDFVTHSKEGGESSEEALVERLNQFVEHSDLSFYEIVSRIGTSAGILSMWLARARKAKPHPEELAAIEKFLKG